MLASLDIKPDVILVINKLSFGRNLTMAAMGHFVPGNTISTPGGTFTTPGHFVGGGSSQFLGANTEFIVYDYNEDDVIAYGTPDAKADFFFAMTKSTWDETFKDIAKSIFRKTPFTWRGLKGH